MIIDLSRLRGHPLQVASFRSDRVCEKLAVRACKKKRGKLGSSVRVEKGRKALCEEKRRRWVGDGHGN